MTIVQLAMTAGLPYTALRDAILVHPTMAEGLARLFLAVPAAPYQQPHGLPRQAAGAPRTSSSV
jgi:hypothetical protein